MPAKVTVCFELPSEQRDTLLDLVRNRLYLLENREVNEFDQDHSDHEEIIELKKIEKTLEQELQGGRHEFSIAGKQVCLNYESRI